MALYDALSADDRARLLPRKLPPAPSRNPETQVGLPNVALQTYQVRLREDPEPAFPLCRMIDEAVRKWS